MREGSLVAQRVSLPTSQEVPYAARIPRVGHLGLPLQQARDLLGHRLGMLAEFLKGRRDRR